MSNRIVTHVIKSETIVCVNCPNSILRCNLKEAFLRLFRSFTFFFFIYSTSFLWEFPDFAIRVTFFSFSLHLVRICALISQLQIEQQLLPFFCFAVYSVHSFTMFEALFAAAPNSWDSTCWWKENDSLIWWFSKSKLTVRIFLVGWSWWLFDDKEELELKDDEFAGNAVKMSASLACTCSRSKVLLKNFYTFSWLMERWIPRIRFNAFGVRPRKSDMKNNSNSCRSGSTWVFSPKGTVSFEIFD